VLTVIASEGYKEFVSGLQEDMLKALSARPRKADTEYFAGKVLHTSTVPVDATEKIAQMLSAYLLVNGYIDDNHVITPEYHEAKSAGTLTPLPPLLAPHAVELFRLVDSVFSPAMSASAKPPISFREVRSQPVGIASSSVTPLAPRSIHPASLPHVGGSQVVGRVGYRNHAHARCRDLTGF
jgi:hypothetical protein